MRRKLLNLLLVTILLLAIPGTLALASDISGALYRMSIVVSNNGSLANYVSTNGVISTPNLIAGGFLNASANNCAVLDKADNDVPFMPGYSTNPWAFWVETIGADSYINYDLYTHNSTGGAIAYFPTATGMIVSDNATLELGDDFDVEIEGWVDTDAGSNKNLVNKDSAFKIYISDTGKITAQISSTTQLEQLLQDAGRGLWNGQRTRAGERFTNFPACTVTQVSFYLKKDGAPPGNYTVTMRDVATDTIIETIATEVANNLGAGYAWKNWTGAWVNPSTEDVRFLVEYDDGDGANSIDVGYQSTDVEADAVCTFYQAGYTDVGAQDCTFKVYYTIFVEATAINVTSDEYNVHASANTTNLTISIDGAGTGDGYDSTALAGATVPDNGNDWDFFLNDAMPYMLSANVIVAGNISSWVWEYDTTFYDSIGANDATPTFRTASSDADVVATAVSFQPIEEAKAPPWTLDETTATWLTAGNVTGNFTTTPSPTYPGADVIEDIAAASGTPAQLPFVIIFGFITLAVSLTISSVLRQYGSRSLAVKVIVIGGLLGVGEALGIVDFWMLVFFLILALAIMAASKHGSIT